MNHVIRCCTTLLVAVVVLLLTTMPTRTATAAPGDVLISFSAPGAAPRDLAWDGSSVWVLDDQDLRMDQLDPTTGEVLRSVMLPTTAPRGLAWGSQRMWVSSSAELTLVRLGPDLETIEHSIPAPGLGGTAVTPFEPGALTIDGMTLWSGVVAGWSSRINQVDALTGEVLRFVFTKGFPEGVATDGMSLWTATSNGGHRRGIVYQYDYETGLYVSHFDTPGDTPVGLAFDGEALWCADRETRTIYRLALR